MRGYSDFKKNDGLKFVRENALITNVLVACKLQFGG